MEAPNNMEATCESKTWLLDRYARFVPSNKNGQGEWKESIPLYGPEKEPCTKAIQKGDSMLFFCKSKDNVRRFRIQFSKGQTSNERDNCSDFLRVISEYIQIKTVESHEDENISQSSSQSLLADASQSQLNSSLEYLPPNKAPRAEVPDSKIFSAKSIRQVAESLMANSSSCSSENCKSDPISMGDGDVESLVKSCLLDPEFPSFVARVEESLKRLISE